MFSRFAGWLWGQAYLLLVLTTFFWGGNMAAGRAAVGDIPPVTLATLRWTIAFLLMLPVAWPHLKEDWPVIRRHFRYFALISLTGISAFNTLVYVGLEHTTAIKAALLQSTQPLLIGLWSFILFSQALTARQLFGIGLSAIGVVGIVTEWSPRALLGLDINIGDIIIFAGCICYALYSALLRRIPATHWSSSLTTTFAMGALFLVPFWLWEMASGRSMNIEPKTLFIIGYVAIFPSIVSFLCFMRGVQLVGPNRAGPLMHLIPVFGTLFAIVFLGERLHLFHVASFALIFCGITIATRRGRVTGVPAA